MGLDIQEQQESNMLIADEASKCHLKRHHQFSISTLLIYIQFSVVAGNQRFIWHNITHRKTLGLIRLLCSQASA